EEWGSTSPFQFFSSHPEPELARATAQGRKREFAEHGWDADEIPDPQDPATFERSKLNWDEIDNDDHGRLRRVYQQLIALRNTEHDMADAWVDALRIDFDEDGRWIVMFRGSLAIACNLGTESVVLPLAGELIAQWGSPVLDANGLTLEGHSFAIV